ncbi:MAG: flagellar basal-body MS-ring/collar protein FliF [Pseudomonadota bacterium]
MDELKKIIETIGVARLGAIIGVSFGVALALALIMARAGAPSMSILYADIGYGQAQPIISRLEQDGVDYALRDNGGRVTILAPRNRLGDLRIDFAADGVGVGDGVGYEIFDDGQALGVTAFQQNINRLRALEGEIARTLTTISGVRSARVHLVLPERELFSRDRQSASASIVVDAPAGINSRAVRAIVNMAASAVPGLEPGRVTVMDARGELLASGGDDSSPEAIAASVEDRKAAAQERLRRAVEDMVGRIVGPENVRVEINADMDFSRVTESSEIVDPDSQTVLSSSTIEETSNSAEPSAARGVSVANALPGGAAFEADGGSATSTTQRLEETTNYEITKTVRNAVREEGLVVKRVSVAVAINTGEAAGADGEPAFAVRDPAELAVIETLVKSAIGFSAERGDQVSVVNIGFSPAAQVTANPIAADANTNGFTPSDALRMAELAALSLIAIALVWFAVRVVFSNNAQTAITAATPRSAVSATAAKAVEAPAEPSAIEHHIDLAQVEGQVRASSVNKVAEIVRAHSEESAGLLRSWMRPAS